MLILLSNDDGIGAPGLEALAAALAGHEVWTVAPAGERSAAGHSFSLHRPLLGRALAPRTWSLDGTPTDCVYWALHHLLPRPPDLVLSGINRGANLGNDVYYSGTVAAAREGAMWGIPAIAASLYVTDWSATPSWVEACRICLELIEGERWRGLPDGTLLNLNVPDVPRVKGLRWTRAGRRRWHPHVVASEDHSGRSWFSLGGGHESFDEIPGSDGVAASAGWATCTPLQLDPTDHTALERILKQDG